MPPPSTLQGRITDARRRLERAGIEPSEAALDAQLLARHALGGWERGQLIAGMRDPVPAGFDEAFEPLVRRREAREPTAYITRHREFWNIEIAVAPGVLVPRPETEFVVEEVLGRVRDGSGPLRIADVGTGSGCLAVALARWLPAALVTAIDESPVALAMAARNVTAHGVAARVSLVRGDLLDTHRGPFDVIVSNPPYVPAGDIPTLPREVRDYEPVGALDGGPDGLGIIRRLVPEAASRLVDGGWLVFEFGFGQRDGVRAIVKAEPMLELIAVREDLAGIPRVAVAQRRFAASGPSPESRIPNPD